MLDGNLDDWPGQPIDISAVVFGETYWTGPADLRARAARMEPIADEYIIVDTGLTPTGRTIIEDFAKRAVAPVKIVKYMGRLKDYDGRLDNYARARNLAQTIHAKLA